MGMMIVLFVAELFTTILQRIFCESILQKKKVGKRVEYTVWAVFFVLVNAVTYPMKHIAWFNTLAFLLLFYVLLRVLYLDERRTCISVTVFLYISGMCSEFLVFYGKELIPYGQQVEDELFFIVLTKLVWFCIIKLVSLLIRLRRKEELGLQDWIEVLTVPVGSMLILLALFEGGGENGAVLDFIAVVMIFLINVATYYLYDMGKEAIEKKLREEILLQQCEYYVRQNNESKAWWQELERFRHDMKQRYLLEKAYLDAGDYDALRTYIDESTEFIAHRSVVSRTGNIYIDSILNYKADLARKHQIQLEPQLRIPSDARFNAEDITICLGNLLDNAIEAASELQGDKTIAIRLENDGHNLFINLRNPFQKARQKKDGQYVTGKDDHRAHGYGLGIVRRIVEKYDGEFRIDEGEADFTVSILLYQFIE